MSLKYLKWKKFINFGRKTKEGNCLKSDSPWESSNLAAQAKHNTPHNAVC